MRIAVSRICNIDYANILLAKTSGKLNKIKFATGISDFKQVIESGCLFIDKTLFIKEILDSGDGVTLITRPRRWGKTLGLSMLKYFLGLEIDEQGKEVEQNSNRSLFDYLEIAKTEQINEQGKHPVIFITLKDIKGSSYQEIGNNLKQKTSEVFKEFAYIYEALKKKDSLINKIDLSQFDRILCGEANKLDMTNSIKLLSRLIFEYHGKAPYILIDEYDVPLNNAYNTNYYTETLSLIRALFETGIKDNSCMKKSIVTGVFKIAKSGLWTGMNNSSDYSIVSKRYAQYFGFTDNELDSLLLQANIQDNIIKSAVKEWYNG